MAQNRNWCMIDAERLVFAPTWVMAAAGLVVNPTDEQYRAAGWLENCAEPPATPDGMMVVATRYEARDGRVVAVYEYAPAPKPPRVFSKLYLILALQRRGLYEKFKAMLDGCGLTDLWVAANKLSDQFAGFDEYLLQAKTALELTDAEAEEILGEAVAR